jgi:hypothetical protein
MVTLHPVVPNPYTLLSLIPTDAVVFTCLDLKETFFCIRLAPLAFQWDDPKHGRRQQYTWTRLPQWFKNSLTIFVQALASDLKMFPAGHMRCTLLQYVDDLLFAERISEKCTEGTYLLLKHLWEAGYKVSKKKSPICHPKVKYLSFHISQETRCLGSEQKQTVCSIPVPTTQKQI